MEQPRVAVIGLRMGFHHADNLAKSGLAKVVACCDLNEELRGKAAQVGARFYTDYRKMLDENSVDGVVIALPHHLHRAMGVECANRRLHIYMEKPLDYTIEGAQEIITAARANNVHVMVGYQWRYMAAVQTARDMITTTRSTGGLILTLKGSWY